MGAFLTALSPDARIQGSRDPLGLLPIWSRLGRRVVGNVTTVAADLRGWTTLLVAVGLHEHGASKGWWRDDDLEPLYRAEQLIGYAREVHDNGDGVRGIGRIRMLLRDHAGGGQRIPLGRTRERRILNNQRSAGVWGQIAASARTSQLVSAKQPTLAPAGAQLWSAVFAPRLLPHSKALRSILNDTRGFGPRGSDTALAQALAELTDATLHPAEVTVYRDHILHAGEGSQSYQAQLVQLMRQDLTAPMSQSHLRLLATQAPPQGDLAERLLDIAHAESALGPLERLFSWLLAKHRQPIAAVVKDIEAAWPEPLHQASEATDTLFRQPMADAYGSSASTLFAPLTRARDALASGAYKQAVLAVVELNAAVMARRGGAPWVQIQGDVLDVRLGSDDATNLPAPTEAANTLVHSYYLEQLQRLTRSWERAQ